MTAAAHWVLRIALAAVFIPHGLGKFLYTTAFTEKFDLPAALSLAAGAAELAGAGGILAGGFLARHRAGSWLTQLGATAIIVVQVGAITVAHWPAWLYFVGGMEYNVVLIAVCLYLLLAPSPVGNFPRPRR